MCRVGFPGKEAHWRFHRGRRSHVRNAELFYCDIPLLAALDESVAPGTDRLRFG